MAEKKPQTKAKKIYNVVSTLVVALIFVFLVATVAIMLVQQKSGGESKIFGYYMYDVLSDSMSGTIEKGEVILCKEVEDVNSLEEGDIITFTAPEGVLKGYNETHRIVEIVRKEDGSIDYIKTAGDKLYDGKIKVDNWQLSPENVKAKFVKKSVFVGGLRQFLSHWYGYVVLVVLPLCIVFGLIVAGFVRDRVALETEKDGGKVALDDLSDEEKKKLLDEIEKHAADNGDTPTENNTAAENSTTTENSTGADNGDTTADNSDATADASEGSADTSGAKGKE